MFPVTPINGNAYFGDGPVKAKEELNMETFMRLLIVQLVNQNPLEPMKDADFFAQMAQLGQVQGLNNIQDSMEMTQAASLIGKTVTAVRPNTLSGFEADNLVTGQVTSLTIRNGERWIGLEEADGGIVEVQLGSIRQISE